MKRGKTARTDSAEYILGQLHRRWGLLTRSRQGRGLGVLLETEHAFDPSRARALGVDTDALLDRRGYDRPVEWWVLRPRS